jgi:hypothetical protein
MSKFAATLVMLSLVLPQHSKVTPIHFRDIGRQVGLTTMPNVSSEKRYIVEMMAGGIALFDCDNDGKLDIVVVVDSSVDRYLHGGDRMVTLYHQDSPLHFTDITEAAGLTTLGWGMGIAIGDFDNDGLPDLYVTGYGHNVLYRNLGGCRFADVTEHAHVGGGGFSVGAAWADYDRDGHLDLFVSRYMDSDVHNLPKPGDKSFNYRGIAMEVPVMEGERSLLYHNRGDGTFEEVAEKAGVNNAERRLGMGVTWGDYDNDGWPDLFVTNDMGANCLYHNKHDGTFEDVGMLSGTALSVEGKAMGNMAADFADVDHDGLLDLVVTRYGYQPMSLYRNLGSRGFGDVTRASQVSQVKDMPVRWGVASPISITMAGSIFSSPTATYRQSLTSFHMNLNIVNQFNSFGIGEMAPSKRYPMPPDLTMVPCIRAVERLSVISTMTATWTWSCITLARHLHFSSTSRRLSITEFFSDSSEPRATGRRLARA